MLLGPTTASSSLSCIAVNTKGWIDEWNWVIWALYCPCDWAKWKEVLLQFSRLVILEKVIRKLKMRQKQFNLAFQCHIEELFNRDYLLHKSVKLYTHYRGRAQIC